MHSYIFKTDIMICVENDCRLYFVIICRFVEDSTVNHYYRNSARRPFKLFFYGKGKGKDEKKKYKTPRFSLRPTNLESVSRTGNRVSNKQMITMDNRSFFKTLPVVGHEATNSEIVSQAFNRTVTNNSNFLIPEVFLGSTTDISNADL